METTPEPTILSACGGKLTVPEKYFSAAYKGKRVQFYARLKVTPMDS